MTKEYGPSEIPGFIGKESGIESNSTQMQELYTNWSLTTRQSLAGVRKMGGVSFMSCSAVDPFESGRPAPFLFLTPPRGWQFTWSNFNCMLDTDAGYSCPPSDLAGCGLHKTVREQQVLSSSLAHGRAAL